MGRIQEVLKLDRRLLKGSIVIGLACGIGLCLIIKENPGNAGSSAKRELPSEPSTGTNEPEVAGKHLEFSLHTAKQAPRGGPLFRPSLPGKRFRLDLRNAKKRGNEYVLSLGQGLVVHLTLKTWLQEYVERIFARYAPLEAAFVAINPQTGEILAMAEYWNDQPGPVHRALLADGPAASIFKLVTSAALLEGRGVPSQQMFCFRGNGGMRGLSKRTIVAELTGNQNCETLAEALGHSRNAVFARLTYRKLTRADLLLYAERFGFNKAIPFELPVEPSKADLPTDRVELAKAAAGFYHTTLSPLHAALIAAAIANKGIMPKPYVVSYLDKRGIQLYQAKPGDTLAEVVSAQTALELAGMMLETTQSGTARKYFRKWTERFPNTQVAGKTGSLSVKVKRGRKYYSWFIGFAPIDRPTIAVASLVVNGPKWRVKGPYVAKVVLQQYFSHASKMLANRK